MKRQLLALALCAAACATPPAPAAHYAGPIIDAHAHIRLGQSDPTGSLTHPIGADALLKLDDEAKVATSALIVVARRGDPSGTREKNDKVIAIAAASKGRFYPVASVHPLDGAEALAELERLAALKVRVIKLHPNSQNFDVGDPAVASLAARAGELGLILLFDSYKPGDASEMGKFVMLCARNPGTKFILAHMGFSQFRETLAFALLRKLDAPVNVWFDLSAIASAYADSPAEAELLWTIRQIGVSQFLFGSDWPLDTPATALDAVRRLGLTPAEERKVLHDNAAGLLRAP